MASDAIANDKISRAVGYKIKKGDFRETSPNLPQRIAIIAEANTANQGALDTEAVVITSAKQAGELYGYGSPIHQIMRILRPISGDGVGGIPTIVIAVAAAVGATSRKLIITPSGVATKNGTHYVKVAGRTILDGLSYAINIVQGDTTAQITAKIEDAVNAVLGSPASAVSTDYEATLETKWKGLTANDFQVSVDTGDDDLGITYVVSVNQVAAGTPSVATALTKLADEWFTYVVNGFGLVSTVLTSLEGVNGIPLDLNPTGRYLPTVMKPFIAITGSISQDPSASTDSRLNDVTIAVAPAPLSEGFPFEAAANMTYLAALQAQNNPHLDVAGKTYPDMPTPSAIGTMSDYANRDIIVKKGCSTVSLSAGKYLVQDFITTYHPVGEAVPAFRYCRNLMLDFNVRYGYLLLEAINVLDHSIANDDDIVVVNGVVKPKQWTQILNAYADDLTLRALIVEPDFMKESIQVNISSVNPDRFETYFRYKRSGFVRQASTTAEAGFNYGTLN